MSEDKQYLTLEEVADLLAVNYQLIYRLVRNGDIPAVKLGRVYRVERADLDAYLKKQKKHVIENGARCAACGVNFASKEVVCEECEDCGAPICRDCWTRMNRHKCRDCREKSKE